ncbi:22672_t:CDS:1, partial [Gigaspora margarita]
GNEWIQRLLELNNNRIKYMRQTRNYFVSEQSQYLQLLPQHATLPNNYNETNKQSRLYQLLTVNGIEPDLNKKVYVPLIPGYTIYTYYGVYLKISLEWNEAQQMIFYKWIDYGSDWKFITEQNLILQII